MAKNLVIVESPAKAKTIEKFLGKNYVVKASVGHIRDLPKSKLGVDIENNFQPQYINIRGKGTVINELKKEGKKAEKIFLATDPDREGEAISWHLAHILNLDECEKCRIEFNEITKDSIKKAIKSPRAINKNLVDAQQARRILDRLLGYKISPLLWKKVRKGLSAGRVQSVATRLICDREEEIKNFVPQEYWSINLLCETLNNDKVEFKFYGQGDNKLEINNQQQVDEILENIKGKDLEITDVITKERKRSAPKPFTTSMLQQESSNKLGFPTKKTMLIAQQLYEGIDVKGEGTVGLISYIRTDSQRISQEAAEKAKEYIIDELGDKYYKGISNKSSNKKKIQDAHEAIRPTSIQRTPDKIKDSLSKEQYQLYKLIWERFIASLMEDAIYDSYSITGQIGNYTFKASGSKLKFDGFLRVYTFASAEEKMLPHIEKGWALKVEDTIPKQHFTQPPARYTEATLVKTLEELGIGRPSTYAPTIATILAREYVVKQGNSFYPTEIGILVTEIMKQNFEKFVDIDFTAEMENMLDEVEEGNMKWKDVVENVYSSLKDAIEKAEQSIDKVSVEEETGETCEKCGSPMVIKYGRFGKFISCKNYPECKNTKPILNKVGITCPKCKQGEIIVRKTKKGKIFYGCSNYPACNFVSWNKPTGEVCPACGEYLVHKENKKTSKIVCPNKDCNFEKKVEI
ncbi:DNA topoisomerase-1 [Alkalithermobacter thermoalcaliphilus JW-YL-7 = DSM 7308]|uniref:DNA topoisomerase 1 n=1 Tax=Alkalithermobacter thermoalcaliphilus JW-YL-7 = DSM 7308 TaxID=1121328 RepID=A0A150FQT1_CLOPD|nr:DNA topoisomerase I [[Clostridium] paradoxum JW-YL-7 = DSM 7308]SHK75596.1 DNA topoisomerase-1 [[Clostridium] paradoxum JW-YL-7 = DSM 7308]